MAGTDTARGINFQYSCGISFILDSLQQPRWKTLQFEGNKDIEDIVVFDDKEEILLRVQVKQKESPQRWEPSDLKDVLLRFLECGDSEMAIYQFAYAGSEGPALINDLNPILHKIELKGCSSLTICNSPGPLGTCQTSSNPVK